MPTQLSRRNPVTVLSTATSPNLVILDKGTRQDKIALHPGSSRVAYHELTDALLVQLIDSLALASHIKKQELETLLATFGDQYPDLVVPQLLKNLLHTDASVRATVAMVLIRLGVCVVPALRQFYNQHQHHAALHPVTSLILDQLGHPLEINSEIMATPALV